ncbi:DinB family protein [Nesterenkonia muleiensis]|uniref:DinB family protein n=1 Tax=Nesterenkonia muleiensis TaxID=2282648 RepID=UPI000E754714|nr:DinB family protein [Nesterenkonia muleiensis]
MDHVEYDEKYTEQFVLLAYLNRVRGSVIRTAEGVSEEDLRRPQVPSGTSLLGIVHHLTGVEHHWFQRVFLGETIEADKSMIVPDDIAAADVVEAYQRACQRSDEIVHATADLSVRAAIPNPGEDARDSLRVILAHMVEETARHAGHADILREQIDGTTGL